VLKPSGLVRAQSGANLHRPTFTPDPGVNSSGPLSVRAHSLSRSSRSFATHHALKLCAGVGLLPQPPRLHCGHPAELPVRLLTVASHVVVAQVAVESKVCKRTIMFQFQALKA